MSKTSKSITAAAASAGELITRFSRLESEARVAREEAETKAVMRALLLPDGHHYVRLERDATTIEIENGAIAISVRHAPGEEK